MSLLRSDNAILGGKLVDEWWRIEFQNRGSPHLHMLVWVEGTPSFDTPQGIARIDEVITCELPDNDEEMKTLVNGVQRHHHTQTCYKNGSVECRFNFPRIPSNQTHIVANTSDEFIKNGGRMCILERKPEANFINNYNKTMLKCWKGNMDIQPCGNNESIANYLAKYCSKNEPTEVSAGVRDAIRTIRQEQSSTSHKMFKICMKIVRERHVSACECSFRLGHLPFRHASRKCVFLNTRKPEQRYKVFRFVNDDAAGYCTNIFERYTNRPHAHPDYDFENMTLVEFAMLFEPHYSTTTVLDEDAGDHEAYDDRLNAPKIRFVTLLNGTKKMKIRSRPAVMRVPIFREPNDPENYYYSLLAQYVPFRDEDELLRGYDSSKEAFLAREAELIATSRYMEIHRVRDRQLDNAVNQANAFIQLQNPVNEEIELDDNDYDADDVRVSDGLFRYHLSMMNVGQTDLFNFITKSIDEQKKGSADPVRMFITGGAGTGKTFTLNLIKEQIRRCYGGEMNSVKVGALTGVAARLISGRTLHSMFKLPVQRDGKVTKLPSLTGIYLRSLRLQWRETQFLIIDEISMVPYEMLEHLHLRLQQLKDSNALFGGMNILLFGALMQLPPIRGNAVFHQPKSLEPAIHLWRTLSFCELVQNMRQRGDTTFIDLLNDLGIGELNTEHIEILLGKVDKNLRDEFSVGKALRIDPTNALVDEHNCEALTHHQQQGVNMVDLRAADRISDAIKDISSINLESLIPDDINKTGGLPKALRLFVGAKVMLRYNIDTSKGLVNGAMGEVVDIIWPLFRRAQMYEQDLPNVKINFVDIGEHIIQPRTVEFPAKLSAGTAERRMLPLILCWAVTVHKMQGSTVDRAVINLGPKIFAKGQAYVALTRVRSLEGIRLEDLDVSKIQGKTICNLPALEEMERLRKLPSYRHTI